MHFVVGQEDNTVSHASAYLDEDASVFSESLLRISETSSDRRVSAPSLTTGKQASKIDKFPASVSIDMLLKGDKLIKKQGHANN